MKNNTENPAAFPFPGTEQNYHNQNPLEQQSGMTLRDYFAAKLACELAINQATVLISPIDKIKIWLGLNGWTKNVSYNYESIAKTSYEMADKMLIERLK